MKFVVIVEESYIQDAHIYTGKSFPGFEEDCWDEFNPSAFLGIYTAESSEDAISQAHKNHAWIPVDCMNAHEIHNI